MMKSVPMRLEDLYALFWRLCRFGIVGGAAAVTHWLVVVGVVSATDMNPLVANVIGFLTAFGVSYSGHKNWTFAAQDHAHKETLVKFFSVAVFGFFVNEAVLALGIHALHVRYEISLLGAIFVAAGGTYLLSHFWAFREKTA